jgi:hypothetical protein
MANFEKLIIKDLVKSNGIRQVTPRTTNNLPEEITGAGAVWFKPNSEQLLSYNILVDNLYYPIEFINNTWYFLEWDERPYYHGYWVHPEKGIP